MNARTQLLKVIADYIRANAPEIALIETRRKMYEGVEKFEIIYEHLDFECQRRQGILDTSDLDPHNGTGYDSEVVYDEIVVLQAWNNITGDVIDDIGDEINEFLIS